MLRDEPVSGSVSLDIEESGLDWFDLKVVLNVGDTTLTAEEFVRLKGIMARLVPCAARSLDLLDELTQAKDRTGT